MQPFSFKRIVLTGFMSAGKTTVGQRLAERLNWRFIDSDDWIAQQVGKPVATIFAEQGEAFFRQWEGVAAHTFAQTEQIVMATGGGLMVNPANVADLQPHSLVICLGVAVEEAMRRANQDPQLRPLLQGSDPIQKAQELWQKRQPSYAHFVQVETTGHSSEEVVERILTGLAVGEWKAKGLPEYRLTVSYPGGVYPVVVGRGLLERVQGWLQGKGAVVTDSQVALLYAGICGIDEVIVLPVGESYKRLETVQQIYDGLVSAGIDRQGTVIALGGGVVGDMAGFAAATYLRGVSLMQLPTTLLAMVDSSVGGKAGVDLPQGKNLVGAFKQPDAVLIDLNSLATLPLKELQAGMAEVIKSGLIGSPALGQQVEQGDWTAEQFLASVTPSLVLRAIQVKQAIVEADPFEHGQRAVLNLGHTFGHAIEQVSGYAIGHGQAVAMGLVAAGRLSAKLGICAGTLADKIEMMVQKVGLPARVPDYLPTDDLLQAMNQDKKRQAGKLRFVLLRAVSEPFVSSEVPLTAVRETITELKQPL